MKTRYLWGAVVFAIIFGLFFTTVQKERYFGTEKTVFAAQHEDLAELMRDLRLSNPYSKDTLSHKAWEEQAQFNVPILILSSCYLDAFCRTHHKQRLLFSSRDCCHLVDIFKTLFPDYESFYFYSSRLIYQNPPQAYLDYVDTLYSDSAVIVDGQGTGNTCLAFFSKHFDTSPCYIPIVGVIPERIAIAHRFGDKIEMINYASHGSVYGFTEEGPLFLPLEYDVADVAPAYACIRKCMELLDNYKFGPFDQQLINDLLSSLRSSSPVLREKHCVNHQPP